MFYNYHIFILLHIVVQVVLVSMTKYSLCHSYQWETVFNKAFTLTFDFSFIYEALYTGMKKK